MVDLDFLRRGVEESDFDDATCRGLLDVLAEAGHLRAELAETRRTLAIARQALEATQQQGRMLEAALPDEGLLKRAATWIEAAWVSGIEEGDDDAADIERLRAAAARIREILGASGE